MKDWRDGVFALGAAPFVLAGGNSILVICTAALTAALAAYGSLQPPATNPQASTAGSVGSPTRGAAVFLALFCAGLWPRCIWPTAGCSIWRCL